MAGAGGGLSHPAQRVRPVRMQNLPIQIQYLGETGIACAVVGRMVVGRMVVGRMVVGRMVNCHAPTL